MGIPDWAIWIVIAVAMLAVEATTAAFFTIYFGVAAAIVAAMAAAGVGVPLQILAFGVISVGSLVLTRPQLKRIAGMSSATVPSGVDAMPGKIGIVTKPISELETGLVKVGGEMWTASSYFEHEPIEAGTRVEVVAIKGVTAFVIAAPIEKLEEEN
jgi:membrane protein implicated in regulation of membrane protease activity